MTTAPTGDDLKTLAVKLASVADHVESRLQQVSTHTLSASQSVARQVQDAQAIASHMTREALEQFRLAAAGAIQEGTRIATEHHDQTLATSARKVANAASQLESRMARSAGLQWAIALKTFVALVLASAAVVSAAGYMVWESRQALAGMRWQKDIVDAQAAGKLAPCAEGGLCAMVNKRWTRIDK